MNFDILTTSLFVAQILLGLCLVISCWRIIRGPRAQDRILGLDTLYINAMIMLVSISLQTKNHMYIEIALVIGLLGFTATVVLAKFLMRGEVIE